MKATIIVEGIFRPGYEAHFEQYSPLSAHLGGHFLAILGS
jgi:hypothetical protein